MNNFNNTDQILKTLKEIQCKIIDVIKRYNKYPNKIIIGSEVFYLLMCYSSYELQYNNSNNERELYRIPVVVDYNNPWNVEVCICFNVGCDIKDVNVK